MKMVNYSTNSSMFINFDGLKAVSSIRQLHFPIFSPLKQLNLNLNVFVWPGAKKDMTAEAS